MYELIHPDDVEKLREQLSSAESPNSGRILDLKSKFNLKRKFDLNRVSLILRIFDLKSKFPKSQKLPR